MTATATATETAPFTESQHFRQMWLWLLLLGINGAILVGLYRQFVAGQVFGEPAISSAGLLVALSVTVLLTLLFATLRLETRVESDGIYVRFHPFQSKFEHFAWDRLAKCYVRRYSPLGDYGGWGLRLGLSDKGKAYNVSGDQGLQLEFTDGRKLLIGTNRPEELERVLRERGEWQA